MTENEVIGRKTTIVGINHYGGVEEDKCYELVYEPENEFDSYAIQVIDWYGQKVGYIKAGNSGNDRVLFNRQISGDLNNMVIKIIKINNYWASAKIIKRPPSKKEQMKENMKLLIKEYNHYAAMHDEETCKHISKLIKELASIMK